MKTIIPKRNNLKLESISPAISDKYSKNLYKFLSRGAHHSQLYHVYQEKDGDLLLGWWDQGSFIGNALQHILTGILRKPFCYSRLKRSSVKEVRGFWAKYVKIGVCAIDQAHQWYDSRWDYEGKGKRVCQWCGCVQKRRSVVQCKTVHVWDTFMEKTK